MKKDFKTMRPREIEAYLRQQVLKIFGNDVEDKTDIWASHGYYNVVVTSGDKTFSARNFRKTDVPKAIKTLKSEVK